MHLSELESVLQMLVGERVTAKTIAGNSISLWFGGAPKSASAQLWIDPPWRIETSVGIESSSFGFPYEMDENETKDQYHARFEIACANSDCLIETVIESVHLSNTTSDLVVQFSNGRTLCNFTVDLGAENWHFVDYATHRRYGVLVTGAEIEDTDT